MKILEVSDVDLPGRRFNGYDLQLMLNAKGYNAKQLVMNKISKDANVISLISNPGGHYIREKCGKFEERISMQSVIYPFGERILKSEVFRNSDVVHYHLIFNQLLSLFTFNKLAHAKPTVWTLHDPWALTGHCVHPIECKGWLTGCIKCPYLDRYSPLKEDNSNKIWNIKKEVYKSIDIDIVVSSKWMLDLVRKSPLTKHFKRVHLIPFGVDLEQFKQRENRAEIRENLGIAKDAFVIMFRQDIQEWKGLPYIKSMLKKLKTDKNIVILTVGQIGFLKELKKKYKIIEYEWVNDNNLMVDLYSVSDLFLMPSVAESFGMMAIEAMACSLPVIVFEGTALPSITFAPKYGIVIKKGDINAFVTSVKNLISHPEESKFRGNEGRKLVERCYDVNIFNRRMIRLYKEIFKRNKKSKYK